MKHLDEYTHSHLVAWCSAFLDTEYSFKVYATVIRFLDELDSDQAKCVLDWGWSTVYNKARFEVGDMAVR